MRGLFCLALGSRGSAQVAPLRSFPIGRIEWRPMRTKVFFVLAAFLIGSAVYALTYTGPYGELCQTLGGKWASVPSSCVTRLCYWTGSCGYWANPASRCNLLKPDDPISEVYFQLGDPDEVTGNRYIWNERKGSGIEAVIENERLSTLICPT